MSAILEGIKILDLTRVIAGPMCTQILADMGATVYKIEKPGEGDDTRRMGPFLQDPATGQPSNDSALYLAYNRGKHSVTVDIATLEGAQLVRDLSEASGAPVSGVLILVFALEHLLLGPPLPSPVAGTATAVSS